MSGSRQGLEVEDFVDGSGYADAKSWKGDCYATSNFERVSEENLFAAHAKLSPPILFLSSISSVINYRSASNIIPETPCADDPAPANMGYGQSKYLAERILDYAASTLDLRIGAVRIGQIAGTSENPRGWNRREWFPSLVISSRYIGVLPDALGPGVMSDVNWITVDRLADVVVELSDRVSRVSGSTRGLRVFHAVNPQLVTWGSLLPTLQRALEETLPDKGDTSSKSIELVPLST